MAFAAIKIADIGVSFASTGYAIEQWMSGDASDADLAVALTGFVVSVTPVGGEISGLATLSYDIMDPFVDDENLWGPKVAK